MNQSNVQFRKTQDPAIARLIDPVRGYVLTCIRCNKHMKEEAVAAHLCEGEKLEVEGVEFIRDASMRYRCTMCDTTVPIVLVRAHANRHPKARLEEEEWRNFPPAADKHPAKVLEAGRREESNEAKVAPGNGATSSKLPIPAGPAKPDLPATVTSVSPDPPVKLPSQTSGTTVPLSAPPSRAASAVHSVAPHSAPPHLSKPAAEAVPPQRPGVSVQSAAATAVKHPSPVQAAVKPSASPTASPSQMPVKPSPSEKSAAPLASPPQSLASSTPVKLPVSPTPPAPRAVLTVSGAISTEVPGKRRGGEVSYCLRKVRCVELSFLRVFRVYGRAAYCRELSAFQRWRRACKR